MWRRAEITNSYLCRFGFARAKIENSFVVPGGGHNFYALLLVERRRSLDSVVIIRS